MSTAGIDDRDRDDSRLSVAMVVPTLGAGGAERVFVTLARHFDARRFAIDFVVIDGRDLRLADDVPGQVRLHVLGHAGVLRSLPALRRWLREHRPDVLFSTLSHLNLAIAAARPLLPRRLRCIGRETNVVTEQIRCERWPALRLMAYRLCYRNLDAVVCQSRAMVDDLRDHLAFPAERLVRIANPVDIDRVRALAERADDGPPPSATARRALRCVAVGRLDTQKNLLALVRAVAEVGEGIELDVVGSGPHESMLRAAVAELGLHDRVRLHGHQSNPYAWMRRADAMVLASLFEGMPNVVIEALALGLPVVVTPVPATLEVLEGLESHAVIADGFDAPALAAALRRFIADPPGRVPDGAVGRFAARHVAGLYADMIERVAAR